MARAYLRRSMKRLSGVRGCEAGGGRCVGSCVAVVSCSDWLPGTSSALLELLA